MGDVRYVLTLNEEQARIVSRACELYSRLHMGQVEEINHELLVAETHDNISERRDQAMLFLHELKKLYFPSLHGPGHSYGVGKIKKADIAWNAYHALRYRIAWHEHPEGGYGVQFDPPWFWMNEEIPTCEIVSNDKE